VPLNKETDTFSTLLHSSLTLYIEPFTADQDNYNKHLD